MHLMYNIRSIVLAIKAEALPSGGPSSVAKLAQKLKVDDGDAEDIRQSLRIQARGATTPVLKAAVEVEMAMAETEDTRAPIPV